jgi:hypothetical protein
VRSRPRITPATCGEDVANGKGTAWQYQLIQTGDVAVQICWRSALFHSKRRDIVCCFHTI